MKFGLCPGDLQAAQDGQLRALGSLVEQARLAQGSGFDSVWLADHDLSPGGPGAAALMAASAVASCTSAVRIGVLLTLGLSHPLYTAEDIAVLDNISAGRVIVAVQPPLDERALSAYGIDRPAAQERFAEALEICLRAWAPGPFRFQGRHFRVPANLPGNDLAAGIAQLSVTPKPAQPALPAWVLAVDKEAVRLAARLGLPLVGPAGDSLDELGAKFDLYRSLLGREHIGAPVALIRDFELTDVEAVIVEAERYRDVLGVNYLLWRPQPGLSAAETAQAIRTVGRCLIPEFRMFGYPQELRSVSL